MERLCSLLAERKFTKVAFNECAVEQINGREGETATFLKRCVLNSGGLGGGFAPRHLKRYVALVVNENVL